jgi:hypothetical protein
MGGRTNAAGPGRAERRIHPLEALSWKTSQSGASIFAGGISSAHHWTGGNDLAFDPGSGKDLGDDAWRGRLHARCGFAAGVDWHSPPASHASAIVMGSDLEAAVACQNRLADVGRATARCGSGGDCDRVPDGHSYCRGYSVGSCVPRLCQSAAGTEDRPRGSRPSSLLGFGVIAWGFAAVGADFSVTRPPRGGPVPPAGFHIRRSGDHAGSYRSIPAG